MRWPCADIPELDVLFVGGFDEEASPLGLLGELTAVSVAPAIANAVYHATGKRIRDLPITVEKLLREILHDAPANIGRDQEEEEKHMPQSEQLEVLVLGSGTGGKLIAWHMAQSGRRTAVVERRWVGGSCPNIACMPSKNEISSAKVAQLGASRRSTMAR